MIVNDTIAFLINYELECNIHTRLYSIMAHNNPTISLLFFIGTFCILWIYIMIAPCMH